MKSLKRTLCLVLALVMVLGLFGIASATNFTDDNTIQYKEAVDVMTGIGAINGMGDGTFAPKGTITRAQAAKLVTYAVLGKAAAERLTGVTSSFTDVTVDGGFAWAIPSIEYLVSKGVINGMGDGTFNPNGEISGYAVLKLLLCSLGYGAKGEYTGTGWDLQVAIDASRKETNLTGGRVGNGALSAPATREEVALYCLNAIQAPMVKYLSTLDAYISDTGTLGSGSVRTIKSTVYPTLAKTEASEGGVDAMGNPATVWKLSNSEIGAYPANAIVTYNTKQVDVTAIVAALKGYTVDTTNGVAFTMNGVAGSDPYDAANNKSVQAVATHIAAASGNGTIVSVFADSTGKITAITVVANDVAKVATVSTTAVTLTSVNTSPKNASYTINATDDLFAKVAGLAKDDYVVVTPKATAAANITIPTQITGKWTAKTTTGILTVDGKTYALAAAVSADGAAAAPNGDKNSTLWLDANGFVVHAKNEASATDPHFAFVVDSYQTLVNNKITSMAKLIFTDGNTTDVPVVAGADTTITANNLYTVTIDHDTGVYTLTKTTPASGDSGAAAAPVNTVVKFNATAGASNVIKASDKALTTEVTAATNYYNNFYSANVKFIYVNNKTATVMNGVQNVVLPTRDGSTAEKAFCVAAVEANSATDATPVVTAVFLPGVVPAGTPDITKLVYVNSADAAGVQAMTGVDGKSHNVPVYSAFVNGEAQLLPLTAAPTAKSFGTMVESTSVPGAYTLLAYSNTPTAAATTAANISGVLDTSLISVDSKNLTTTGATVIDARSAADKGTTPVAATPAGLAAAFAKYDNVNVTALYNPTNNNATMIYINSIGSEKVPPVTAAFTSTKDSVTDAGDVFTATITNNSSAAPGATVTVTITLTTKTTSAATKTIALTGTGITASGTAAFDLTSASQGDTKTITFTMPAGGVSDLQIAKQ